MSLDELLGTIRAAGDDGDGADPELAAATRLRVVRSLETRARSRHQLVGVATTIAILLAGTVSWALATGQVATLWSPTPEPRVAPEPTTTPPPRPAPRHRQAMAVEPRPSLPPEAVTPPVTVPAPRPARRAAVVGPAAPPVEALYRRAHELHFHGGDPAATLAAWDRYLAAEPVGRFSVEARYNRALVLIRLGRHAEARAALVPFARGEIVPVGYRQAEAEQLVERLAPDP
ncbi:MAG TPA: hypothetical protein VGD37_32575 [Kofleriaceae bacterium]|jgi:hypothetical protein